MSRARLVALAIAVSACRPAGAPTIGVGSTGGRIDPCLTAAADGLVGTASGGTARVGTASVGTEGAIDADNLHRAPQSPADSLVFAQVYETLVRVTCDGRIAPGLAERWSDGRDTTGWRWTLYLRPDARFHDGRPIEARDVAAAWRERRYNTGAEADPRVLAVEGITFESERVLTVHFRDPQRSGPWVLADPYFAVHRIADDSTAVGTGAFRAPRAADVAADGSVALHRAPGFAADRATSSLRFVPANDPRDLVDLGMHAFRTRDRRAIEYATTRTGLRAIPLPADLAYVLMSPARNETPDAATPAPGPARDSASYAAPDDPRWAPLRAALARDILRTTDRQSTDAWWIASEAVARCYGPATHPRARRISAAPRARRLVFAAEDPLAAALASRLVALATRSGTATPEDAALRTLVPELIPPAGESLVAAGATGADLAASLRAGADLAYLIALPRRVLDPCAHWRSLAARASWITPGGVAFVVESAPTLVLAPGAPAVTVDWTGTLRIGERTPGAGTPP